MELKNILIVEDETIVALNLQSRLEEIGYKVLGMITTGESAVAFVQEKQPDLVLMDIRIRGKIDGIEAANQIRSRFNIPVIYVTAYADNETLERAKITEPYGYILKPFESRELSTTIEIALYKHQIDKQIKEREEWLATTLRSIGDGVITTDRQSIVTYINPVAENLTGWRQEEAIGRPLSEVFQTIHEQTRNLIENPVTLALQEEKIVDLKNEALLINKDGTEIPIDDSAALIQDQTGNIKGVVLVFHNITERKQAQRSLEKANQELKIKVQERTEQLQQTVEQLKAEIAQRKKADAALTEKQEQLQAILDNSSTVIYLYDLQNKYLFINRQYENLFNVTKEEIIGKSVYECWPYEIADAFAANNQQVITAKTPIKMEEIAPINGELHTYISVKFLLYNADGIPYAVCGISTDITERKQTENALQESEAKFQKLAKNIPGMIYQYVFHSDGSQGFSYVSPISTEIYGFEPEEIVQNHQIMFDIIHPDDRKSMDEAIQISAQTLQPFQWEGRLLFPSGNIKWIQAISRPEKQVNGEIIWDGVVIDVSDQKQAELAFSNSQSRLQMALNAAQMGTWDWEIETNKITWSKKTEMIFGFTPGSFPGDMESYLTCLYPQDRDHLLEKVNQSLLEKLPYQIEHRILWPDGSVRWVAAIGNTVYKQTGEPIGMSGVVMDITERKQAEELLRDSEFKLRTIIENSNDAITLKDKEGRYLLINQAGAKFLGRDISDILSKRDEELFTPETGKAIWASDQRVMESGTTWHYEEVAESNGIKRTFLSTKCPYTSPQGELMGIIGICRDITDRKQVEEIMRRHLAAVEAASDGIAIVNSAGEYIYLNDSHVKIFGYDNAEELLGKNWQELYESEEIDRIENQVFPIVLEQGKWQGEATAKKRNGTFFTEEISLTSLADGGLICVCRDITERKKVEERLRLRDRAIVASNNGIIICANTQIDSPLIYINPAFERMTGYSAAEVLGKNCRFLQGNDKNQPGLQKLRAAIKEGAGCTVILRNYRKDGSLFWNELTISPIYDSNHNLTHYVGVQSDITDRKQAEEQLRATTSRLSALIENLQLGLLVKDESQQVVLINKSFCDMFKIPVIAPALIGADFSEFAQEYKYLFANPKEFLERHHQINQAREIVTNEEIMMADGRIFERDYVPIFAKGEYRGHLWMYRDITERKQAETALRLTQERLQYLLSSSTAVIYSARVNGSYSATFMSDNVFAITGYTAQEFTQDSSFWANHIHPEDASRILAIVPQIWEQGDQILEYRFLHKNGKHIWIYDQAKLVRDADGNPLEIVGYWADISDRKQAEAALQQAKDQLQAVLNAVPGFVSWVSSDLRYIGVNQNLAATFNLSPEDFVGQSLGFLEHNYQFAELMNQFFASSDNSANIVIDQPINGTIHNHLIAFQKYQQGNSAVSVGIDITDRKKAETALRTSLKEKEVLLKEIHHRVKNNLQVISSLLKLQSAYIKDEQALGLFIDSYNRVKSMALIHEKLYQSSTLAKINAYDYINNLADNLFRSYSVSSASVELNMEIDRIELDIDTAIPCGLIINELVSNSLKYAFSGRTKGEININFLQQSNNNITLSVSDNGVGLPPDFDIEKVNSLGLQLVYNLTNQLDGELEIKCDSGTFFQINFKQLSEIRG